MLKFEQRLANSWPSSQWKDAGVVLAVSGGADSVALLRAFCTLCESKTDRHAVAHYNHGLRAAASDEDERFVAKLSESFGLPFVSERADSEIMQARARDGLEATARRLRYDFLEQVAQQQECRFVATAHTSDDQVETVLHRIVRGTGLGGLAGIPFTRPLGPNAQVVRPLLELTRSDVLQYLGELQQPYRHDASNDELHFTRNRIRHELLPSLRQSFNEQVDSSVLRLSKLASEAQQVIYELANRLKLRVASKAGKNVVVLDCKDLSDEPRYLIREMMIEIWRDMCWPQQSMGFREWDLLADFAQLPMEQLDGLTRMFPGEVTAQRKGGQLTLTRP
jgi:tRNA(Ile)-lysidine synthase